MRPDHRGLWPHADATVTVPTLKPRRVVRDAGAGGRCAPSSSVAVPRRPPPPQPRRPGRNHAPRSAGQRRRRIDPRQHREDRRAAELGRRARDHAIGAEPARRAARRPRCRASCAARWRSSSATCARCRKASCACACCPSASCSTASRAWCATSASGSARRSSCASPAMPPSSTRPCSRRSAIRWCTWCATPSTTASRRPRCASPPARAAHGIIELNAYHKGGNVIVEVSDDGGGLKRDRILAKARERGLVGADEELTDERVLQPDLRARASPRPMWSATCPAAASAWTSSSATSTSSAATCRFIRRRARAAWCASACR